MIVRYWVWDIGGGAGEKTSMFFDEVFGFTIEPWSNLWGWKSTFPDFTQAICVLLRLYAHHSLRLYSKC